MLNEQWMLSLKIFFCSSERVRNKRNQEGKSGSIIPCISVLILSPWTVANGWSLEKDIGVHGHLFRSTICITFLWENNKIWAFNNTVTCITILRCTLDCTSVFLWKVVFMETRTNIAESHSVQKIMKHNKSSSFSANNLIYIRGKPDNSALVSSWVWRISSQKKHIPSNIYYQIFMELP